MFVIRGGPVERQARQHKRGSFFGRCFNFCSCTIAVALFASGGILLSLGYSKFAKKPRDEEGKTLIVSGAVLLGAGGCFSTGVLIWQIFKCSRRKQPPPVKERNPPRRLEDALRCVYQNIPV